MKVFPNCLITEIKTEIFKLRGRWDHTYITDCMKFRTLNEKSDNRFAGIPITTYACNLSHINCGYVLKGILLQS